MKLKIRYENEIQTIELDAKATEEMWVSLSLEGEEISQKEREELIQREWNEQFNKDDYNNCFFHYCTSLILATIISLLGISLFILCNSQLFSVFGSFYISL